MIPILTDEELDACAELHWRKVLGLIQGYGLVDISTPDKSFAVSCIVKAAFYAGYAAAQQRHIDARLEKKFG